MVSDRVLGIVVDRGLRVQAHNSMEMVAEMDRVVKKSFVTFPCIGQQSK